MKQDKETQTPETDEKENKETQPPKTDVTPADPWKETRPVMLPRASANEQKFEFVCVNGRSFQVPRGKTVDVPLPVYEALENARMQTEAAEEDAEKMQPREK